MIRPRWQKTLADVLGNLARSTLVTASILVGLFAIGIILTIHNNLTADMQTGYSAANPANIVLMTSGFDDELVKHITRLEGVRQAEGVTSTNVRIRRVEGEWVSVALFAARHFEDVNINQVKLQTGIWSPAKDEIVFDQNKLSDLGVTPGDEVLMEISPGKTRLFKVVGVVQDQTIGAFGFGGGYFVAPLQGYIHSDSLAYLGIPNRYNQLNITTTQGNDLTGITEVLRRVRKSVEDNGYLVFNTYSRLSTEHPNMTYVQAIAGTLFLLGFLVMFLSGFLITNTLSALLKQQTAQIGIMKTVGGRTYQIVGMYMMVILLYSGVACALSIPLSYAASNKLLVFIAGNMNIALQGERIAPLAVTLQIVIALVVPQFAGFFPILRGARMSVQAALSGFETPTLATKQPARRRLRMRGLSRPLLISLRNVFRRKSRLILTLITLSLGGAVFIATFNVRTSLEVFVERLMRYFRSDVNITLEHDYRVDQITAMLYTLPDVKHVEPWLAARAELVSDDSPVGKNFSVLAPPSDSTLVEPIVIRGRWILPGDEHAVTLSERFLAEFPEIDVGKTLRVKINNKETDWVVVGFFQLAGKSGGLMAYTSYEHLAKITSQMNESGAFRILATRQGLTLEEQEELGRKIESLLRQRGVRVAEVEAGASLNASTARGLNLLTTFLLIMAGLTALVGSIGLAGTMSLSVLERTREIGVMRAIGASDRSLFSLVIVEGAIIGLISWLAGSLLSFPISRAISDTINAAVFDADSTFTWTIDGFIIWLGVVLVLSVVASIMPARSATRLTIREVLSYE